MIRGLTRLISLQASCQMPERGRLRPGGFTLLELLVVIVIIGILGSALVVSVQSGYKQARQANCKSNLRQFGVALTIHRGENDNRTPDWTSNLYPDYVDDRSMYVCRADYYGGRDRIRPKDFVTSIRDNTTLDAAVFLDNRNGTGQTRNRAIESCSYFYEFSAAPVPGGWKAANDVQRETMRDYKMDQMTYGDDNSGRDDENRPLPYSASRIPIIRCYHHWRDQKVYGVAYADRSSRRPSKQHIILNVAYAGNVFVGPPWWEGTIHPGETRQ